MAASSSEAPPLVTTSTGQVRHVKADLPPELVANGRWQKVLVPMLLLWAGGNDDVWLVMRPMIAYALPLIVDSTPDLDSSGMDWSWNGAIVSVVRHSQHAVQATNTIQ